MLCLRASDLQQIWPHMSLSYSMAVCFEAICQNEGTSLVERAAGPGVSSVKRSAPDRLEPEPDLGFSFVFTAVHETVRETALLLIYHSYEKNLLQNLTASRCSARVASPHGHCRGAAAAEYRSGQSKTTSARKS